MLRESWELLQIGRGLDARCRRRQYYKYFFTSCGLRLPFALHYAVSKAAVIGMTRSLARELGRDWIRVN